MSIIGAQIRGDTYLAIVSKGRYKITSLPWGRRAQHKCISRGLLIGETVEVLSDFSKVRPVLLKVKGSTFAIGHGLALQITVRKI